MQKNILTLFLLLASCSSKTTLTEYKNFESIFSNHPSATMIIIDKDQSYTFNTKRATEQFVPASTFKIANSIIALESGIVPNAQDIFYTYQGGEVFLDVWTNSMNLQDAFNSSNVPAYQQIARLVGITNYLDYLKKYQYGNQKVGTNVENFWLQGPLEISALEQVQFLQNLFEQKLPIASSSITQLKDIAYQGLLIEGQAYKLYAKTGWGQGKIGWYVGWVEGPEGVYPFALNIDVTEMSQLPIREELAKRSLIQFINDTK